MVPTESVVEEAALAWLRVASWHIVHRPAMAGFPVAQPMKLYAATFSYLIQLSVGHTVAGIYKTHIIATLHNALLPKNLSGELVEKALRKFLWRAI
jgi:hypothetical protein